MKLLNNFLVLLILVCGVFEKSHGTELNCEFNDFEFYVETFYSCHVTELENTDNTMVITGYSGVHEPNKTDSDVKGIWISDTNTKYIPTNLGILFNLSALEMFNTQLVEIKSQDFNGMENLEELNLSNNKLTSVPIDAFSTLTKLKKVSLINNQIEEIHDGVFSKNLHLENIWLSYNKIKFLGSTLFDELTKLIYVGLWRNICIDQEYIYNHGNTGKIQLKNDIQMNCKKFYPIELFLFEDQITRITKELITELITATEEHQVKIIEVLTKGELLDCEFGDRRVAMTTIYACEVTFLDNENNDMVITGFTGFDEENVPENVRFIYISDTNTKYIPTNLGLLFNINKLVMENTQLVEIKSQDFNGMDDLEELDLTMNYFTSVPKDAFSVLTNLYKISLIANQIEELPNGVFENNLHLQFIYLQENNIKFLGSSIFSGLMQLEEVDLSGNICIDNLYEGNTEIIQLKNDITKQCKTEILNESN